MNKKTLFLSIIFCIISTGIYSQEENTENYFIRNLNHRIYLGYYSSYFDNTNLLQAGYDCALKLIKITSNFNLIDFGIGLNALVAFDDKAGIKDDRLVNARITPGFELNWSIRLYVLSISKINARVFLEGLGMSLIVYSREFPDNGTHVNIGSHLGLGMEHMINDYKVFTALRLFHSSNGKSYENNPALNAVGIITGIQFR